MGIKQSKKQNQEFRSIIARSGIKLRHLCKRAGITPQLLQYYLNSHTDFSRDELIHSLEVLRSLSLQTASDIEALLGQD